MVKGKYLGRPVLELPKKLGNLSKQWKNGEITAVAFRYRHEKVYFYKEVKDYEIRK